MRNGNKGFTLVELSIVIVIIGLIVAGITAGQTLVKNAQLRSMVTQADQIRSSVSTFSLQYNGLPGDITNGSSYWTTSCNAAGSGASVAADCNGDANKQILLAAGNTGEGYIAWWQLDASKILPGKYTPGAVLTGTINTNIPAAKYTGAGVTIGYDSGNMMTVSTAKNIILFGAPVAASIANGGFLTPAQALSVDAKVDDGVAITGSFRASNSAAAANSGTTCVNPTYSLALTTSVCTIGFIL